MKRDLADLRDGSRPRVSFALDVPGIDAMLPGELKNAPAQLSRLQEGLIGLLDMPREIPRDIHPAILTQRGGEAALKTFVR
jgi:hypothetical protein